MIYHRNKIWQSSWWKTCDVYIFWHVFTMRRNFMDSPVLLVSWLSKSDILKKSRDVTVMSTHMWCHSALQSLNRSFISQPTWRDLPSKGWYSFFFSSFPVTFQREVVIKLTENHIVRSMYIYTYIYNSHCGWLQLRCCVC